MFDEITPCQAGYIGENATCGMGSMNVVNVIMR